MSQELSLAFFKSIEKSQGRIKLSDGSHLQITLKEVIPKERPPEGWECFTLAFISPGDRGLLNQGLYQVDFGNAGTVDLFLVPIEADAEEVEYEAIFNRRICQD